MILQNFPYFYFFSFFSDLLSSVFFANDFFTQDIDVAMQPQAVLDSPSAAFASSSVTYSGLTL